MIPIDAVETLAKTLMAKAAIEIPDDYLAGVEDLAGREDGELSAFVLRAMLDNYKVAKEDRRAMCADTGVPRWYVKIGNEARIEGGPVALEAALRRATAAATHSVPLRPNRVHPLWRTDHGNNLGIGAPEIEYSFEPDADWIDLTTVHKGGLFGIDYRMLFPGDGIDGIKRFFLDTLVAFGKRGLACQPAIMGLNLASSSMARMALIAGWPPPPWSADSVMPRSPIPAYWAIRSAGNAPVRSISAARSLNFSRSPRVWRVWTSIFCSSFRLKSIFYTPFSMIAPLNGILLPHARG